MRRAQWLNRRHLTVGTEYRLVITLGSSGIRQVTEKIGVVVIKRFELVAVVGGDNGSVLGMATRESNVAGRGCRSAWSTRPLHDWYALGRPCVHSPL